MIALGERLARKPEGYRFTIGRVLAIYAGLMRRSCSPRSTRRSSRLRCLGS